MTGPLPAWASARRRSARSTAADRSSLVRPRGTDVGAGALAVRASGKPAALPCSAPQRSTLTSGRLVAVAASSATSTDMPPLSTGPLPAGAITIARTCGSMQASATARVSKSTRRRQSRERSSPASLNACRSSATFASDAAASTTPSGSEVALSSRAQSCQPSGFGRTDGSVATVRATRSSRSASTLTPLGATSEASSRKRPSIGATRATPVAAVPRSMVKNERGAEVTPRILPGKADQSPQATDRAPRSRGDRAGWRAAAQANAPRR